MVVAFPEEFTMNFDQSENSGEHLRTLRTWWPQHVIVRIGQVTRQPSKDKRWLIQFGLDQWLSKTKAEIISLTSSEVY